MSDPIAFQGLAADASDPAALRSAVEAAFDYRGDVTITCRSTGQIIEGYVFDLRNDADSGELTARVMPTSGGARLALPLSDIARIEFTGRDTASGKSFETWVKKYVESKRSGQRAAIESEPLE